MSLSRQWSVGLVGAGNISEHHIGALQSIDDVRIVGICDLDREAAVKAAQRFDIEACDSVAALREAGAEVIHVLTPPHTHAAVALEALEQGCHVLIEKPLAEDEDDCRRVAERAAELSLQVCVNHSLLYDPHVRRALETARSGKLGKIVSVDILRGSDYPAFSGGALPPHYRAAGYPFRDLGVHALYLFQAFLGPIEDVQGSWRSLGGDPNLAYDEWRTLVRCRDGLGQFQLSWNVKPLQSQLIVHGTQGVLKVDLFAMFQSRRATTPLPKAAERLVNAFSDTLGPLVDMPRSVYRFARGMIKPYQGLRDLVAAFYQALDSGAPMPVNVEQAAEVVRWVEHVARKADAEHRKTVASYQVDGDVPVLVTGASGAVGGAVVRRLQDKGIRVRCFMRRPPSEPLSGTEVVLGDLGDPAAVDRAVKGARAVIHAGAAMKGGWTEHHCATVIGTQNVIDSCLAHGVEKLVHISSMSVVQQADGEDGSVISERAALEPRADERGAYTQAKLEAEQLVSRYARDEGLPAVLLRPGQIFGGRIPLLTGAVARRVAGRWLVLGDGEVELPLVYLDDVVDAVMMALEGELKEGQIIQLIDEESMTQNDVLEMVGASNGSVIRVPRAAMFFAGRISEPILGAVGRQSPVAEYRLRSAMAKHRFESLNAEGMLHWRPRVGVREGIRREMAAGRVGAL